MRRLANNGGEKAVLARLQKMVADGTLSATNAWSCLSKPELNKAFGKRKPETASFTAEEILQLNALKEKTVRHLERVSQRMCSYCRRPVGKYGYGWHIEHVMCKSKHTESAFDLTNLVLACVDCNMTKNIEVDRKSEPYDIIDPRLKHFNYSQHLRFLSLSTEALCVLKYEAISPEGKSTYSKLHFDRLERMAVLRSISPQVSDRIQDLDDAADKFTRIDDNHPMAKFLTRLKSALAAAS